MEKINYTQPEHQTLKRRAAVIIGVAGALALIAGCESSGSDTPGQNAPEKPACEVQARTGQPYHGILGIYWDVSPGAGAEGKVTYTVDGAQLTQNSLEGTTDYSGSAGHYTAEATVTLQDGSQVECHSAGFDVHKP